MTPRHPRGLPPVLVLTDETRLPDVVALAETMPPTWGLLFRHYTSSDRETLARETARICRRRGIFILVAGDWRLACAVNADGVHMPEGMMRSGGVSPLLNATRTRVLTTSAHGPNGLRLASSLNADAVFLSPVKATASHPGTAPLGVLPFAALTQHSRVPVYALGGLSLEDGHRLMALGAAGLAGIGFAEDA